MTTPHLSSAKLEQRFKGVDEMKTKYYLIALSATLIVLVSTAYPFGGSPPPPPLFKAKNTGPVYQPTVVTSSGRSSIFVRSSIMTKSKIEGKIDIKELTTNPIGIVDGKNFEWKTPSLLINFGFNPVLSDNMLLLFDLGINNSHRLKFSWLATGIGFVFNNDTNHKLRLDLGMNFQFKDFEWYSSETIKAQSDDAIDYDPFISLMYNTDFNDWLINPFLNLSYSKQTLLDKKIEEYAGWPYKNIDVIVVTAGVTFKLNENNVLSVGIPLTFIEGIHHTDKAIVTPYLQFSYFWGDNK